MKRKSDQWIIVEMSMCENAPPFTMQVHSLRRRAIVMICRRDDFPAELIRKVRVTISVWLAITVKLPQSQLFGIAFLT